MFTTTLPDSTFFTFVLMISSAIGLIFRFACRLVGIFRTRWKYNKTINRAKWLLNELTKIRNRATVETIDNFIDFVELISRPGNHVKNLSDLENCLTREETRRLYLICFALDIADNTKNNTNTEYDEFDRNHVYLGGTAEVPYHASTYTWKYSFEVEKCRPLVCKQAEKIMDLTLLKLNEALLS